MVAFHLVTPTRSCSFLRNSRVVQTVSTVSFLSFGDERCFQRVRLGEFSREQRASDESPLNQLKRRDGIQPNCSITSSHVLLALFYLPRLFVIKTIVKRLYTDPNSDVGRLSSR